MNPDRTFCSILLKDIKKDLLKVLPHHAIKGIWTWKMESSQTPLFEVHMPENDVFPNGYYFYKSGYYASEIKAEMFIEIFDRIVNNRLDDDEKYPIKVTPAQIEKAKKIAEDLEGN